MVEKAIIHHVCPECKKLSYPFGQKEKTLPFMDPIKCLYCGFEVEGYVLDSELTKEVLKKELKLDKQQTDDSHLLILNKRLDALEANLTAIVKEQELLRTKIDLITKDEIQKVKTELSGHRFDINSIHTRVNKIDTQIEYAKKYGKFAPDE